MNNAKRLLWIPSGAASFSSSIIIFAVLLTLLLRDLSYLTFFSPVCSPFCFLYQEKQVASHKNLPTKALSVALIGNHLQLFF